MDLVKSNKSAALLNAVRKYTQDFIKSITRAQEHCSEGDTSKELTIELNQVTVIEKDGKSKKYKLIEIGNRFQIFAAKFMRSPLSGI